MIFFGKVMLLALSNKMLIHVWAKKKTVIMSIDKTITLKKNC